MSNLTLKVPNFPGKQMLVARTSRLGLKLAKHSPEICVVTGIAAGIAATVFACKATLRVNEVLEFHQDTMNNINKIRKMAEEGNPVNGYSVEEADKEKYILFLKTTVEMGKLYAPSIFLGAVSIGLILGGHHILAKRNAALGLAYAGLQKAYDEYRIRVRDEVGEEKELDIFKGVRTRVEELESKTGKPVKKKVTELDHPASPYTRLFDEGSRWWKKDAEQNKFFLQMQENHMNDLLRLRGHLFLNEVFDALDLPRTKMGAVCGWVYGGDGDSFVSFGIWDATKAETRAFINGAERNIWLDFNCDGVIYDLI